MVLNGLRFNERRVYLVSRFFDNIVIEQNLVPGVTPEHFNDDVVLATLDRISEYGSTELFNKIVLEVMVKRDFGTHLLYVDMMTFNVHSDYDNDEDFGTIRITQVTTKTTGGSSNSSSSRWSRTSMEFPCLPNRTWATSQTGRSCSIPPKGQTEPEPRR